MGRELPADVLSRRLPFVALCTYDTRSCEERDLERALEVTCAVHGRRLPSTGSAGPRLRPHAGDGCLVLAGEADLTCAPIVRPLVVGAARDLERMRIDISGPSFIYVAAVSALLDASRDLGSRFAETLLEGASETFRRIWSLLELDALPGIKLASRQAATA